MSALEVLAVCLVLGLAMSQLILIAEHLRQIAPALRDIGNSRK